ncbi:puromycin-sensitive aminopeptidase-like isoform X2 [Brevipalpus obovatus]
MNFLYSKTIRLAFSCIRSERYQFFSQSSSTLCSSRLLTKPRKLIINSHSRQIHRNPIVSSFRSLLSIRNKCFNISSVHRVTMANSGDSATCDTKKPFERLPTTVVPSFYNITLKPDLVDLTFTGSENVSIQIKESLNEIVLNVEDLVINEAAYTASGCDERAEGEVSIDSDNQVARIKFIKNLQPGSGTLYMSFTGILNDQMKGFYRSKYKAQNGEERYCATTQFETNFARRAFPCWDEPAIKARFQVTMIAPKDLTVLSNTNVVSETPHKEDAGLKVVKFGETPIMSTYLVAFVVGEYEYIETKTERGTSVKVYTQIGKKDQGKFALETASKCLTLFEKYFNIPYPLEKLDHIAIPDFASGAMENWGLVTYRETCILDDPKNTSSANREFIATCVCHETAHQWFGNLVTMEWWTHLWLNEGFATFMQYLATDGIYPELDIWLQFVTSSSLPAFGLDSFHNSHPIEVPVGHPDEVESIFDAISYEKGGSIIRMCYNWIGDEAFKRGMQNYLTKHAYKNTFTEDLWEALGEASKKPVEEMMSTWTKQRGFPLVQVSTRVENDKRILSLKQEQFTFDGQLIGDEKTALWQIPISMITSSNPKNSTAPILMKDRSFEIHLNDVSPSDWIKINPNCESFHRVGYSSDLLELLKPAIREKKIGAIDRLQIVSDLFATSIAGKTSTVDFLGILSCYNQEDSYVTWNAISGGFSKLDSLLAHTDYQSLFHAFGRKFYAQIFSKLGFDQQPDNKHTDNLLRVLVLSRLLDFGDENVINEAKKRFADHCNGKIMAPDLRSVVYRTIAIFGSDKEFDMLFELNDKEELQEEKGRLIKSAAAAHDPVRIQRVLDFSLSDKVRSQDAWSVICSSTGSKKGRELAWTFFRKNFEELKRRYGNHYSTSCIIERTTYGFVSDEKYAEVESFFAEHPLPGLELVILRGLESIKNNNRWLLKESQPVGQFLQSFK